MAKANKQKFVNEFALDFEAQLWPVAAQLWPVAAQLWPVAAQLWAPAGTSMYWITLSTTR